MAETVVIVGAAGGTGVKCVEQALEAGYRVKAGRREAVLPDSLKHLQEDSKEDFTGRLEPVVADVRDVDTLRAAFAGAKYVIFAAAASMRRGEKSANDAAAVDRDGIINTARAALDCDVSKVVFVSSACITSPDSGIYRMVGAMYPADIMQMKLAGYEGVLELYREANKPNCTYTFVRPGGLTDNAPVGLPNLRVSTGDEIGGEISRADVADICVHALTSDAASGKTFECYRVGSEAKFQSMGVMTTMLFFATVCQP
mmetsp:Transcript_17079/g.52448  ORF Transcript_17079/g.52448 Transcript_17079/m.52448 type:complete len:257 (-) Transcript_17079:406-1176(-)